MTEQELTEQELTELEELANKSTNRPWILAMDEQIGDNWLVALGRSMDGHSYAITTHNVHASELNGDARTDGQYIIVACNRVPKLIAEIRRLIAERNQLITTNAELRLRLERAQRKP